MLTPPRGTRGRCRSRRAATSTRRMASRTIGTRRGAPSSRAPRAARRTETPGAARRPRRGGRRRPRRSPRGPRASTRRPPAGRRSSAARGDPARAAPRRRCAWCSRSGAGSAGRRAGAALHRPPTPATVSASAARDQVRAGRTTWNEPSRPCGLPTTPTSSSLDDVDEDAAVLLHRGAFTTVRSACAVRPPWPMTFP